MIYWLVFLSVFINYAVGSMVVLKCDRYLPTLLVIFVESSIVTAIFALLSWVITL